MTILATIFVVPALGEELLFRWALFPRQGVRHRWLLVTLSVALFVLWHPLQAWTGLGPVWSELFLHPAFLACVAILGVTLAALRDASSSLWPPIFFHWAVVAAWKLLFGGPF
nr:CPBP family glutamic-type intramembrane protease [Qipengyuania vesicularis]